MENLEIYEKARSVPDEAKKTISDGRLKGMTDINPMFRIKRLTEIFGPCGIGWWYDITDKKIVDDEITHQRAAFVDVLLFYVNPSDGVVSHGIPGTGGASFVRQENRGPYLSDECFKMALTDAISVAAKAVGVAADVYYAKDRTKYTQDGGELGPKPAAPLSNVCADCGKTITDWVTAAGEIKMKAADVAVMSHKEFQRPLCIGCIQNLRKAK